MKLVILSMLGAADHHVVRQILNARPDATIIRPIPSGPPEPGRPLSAKLRSALRHPYTAVASIVRDKLRARIGTRVNREVRRGLFGDPEQEPDKPPHETVGLHELNTPAFAKRLKALAPDVMIVSGAPILKKRIFSVPSIATVNVHHGIVGSYRGENCLYWSLVREDWDNLGVSVHHIDAGIDSGAVLAKCHVALDRDDTEATLMRKFAEALGRLAPDVLTALESGPCPGQPQDGQGTLFLYRDWRVRRLVWRWIRRNVMRIRPPVRPEHTVHYF